MPGVDGISWDWLALKYAALVLLAIWGTLALARVRRRWWAWLAALALSFALAWLALGSGFSIRLPSPYARMAVLQYVVHGNRVHALARPVDHPRMAPLHIIFSIDPGSKTGARMRKTFFRAVRARQQSRDAKRPIIIDMRGYRALFGKLKYKTSTPLPPKRVPRRPQGWSQ